MKLVSRACSIVLPSLIVLAACSHAAENPDDAAGNEASTSLPNILLIVADDLGYSDIGAFGSEISTPNLDDLAAKGLVLSNFYTGPTCSVSRSMLLSGMDNHLAGLGNMAETVADNQLGRPGYEGHLNNQVDTVAELVGSAGYHTYMAGKWHLGMEPEQSPRHRGFEQSFALLYGAGSHFADLAGPDVYRNPVIYRENGRLIDELPTDFFSTSFYTDRVISQIDSNSGSGKPFFAYLAYTAPHWPLQTPDEYLDKYRGRYDAGYDKIREGRFAKQQQQRLFPTATAKPPRPHNVKPWGKLSSEQQDYHARNMEIYAAMVEHMDMSIGRVLEYLDQQGELDNTIVVFISDNGAEEWDHDSAPPSIGKFADTFDNSPENRGRPGSFVLYGPEWAHVSNTPYTRYKGSTYQGAIRSPAIVYWPGKIPQGQTSSALTFITDWHATFIDIAGVSQQTESSGKSLVPLMTGDVEQVRQDSETIGIEAWGKRGVIGPRFKLVSSPKKPHGQAAWELYDTINDPSEQLDLAKVKPELLATMKRQWDKYQSNNNVILPEGPFRIRPPAEKPKQ